MPKIITKCKKCQKDICDYEAEKRLFCSKKCRFARDQKCCKSCNTLFYNTKHPHSIFCSKTCDINYKKRLVINDFSDTTEESAYWAGFIFGDGHVVNNRLIVGLSINNKENLFLLQKLSHFIHGVDYVKTYKRIYSFAVSDINIINNLLRFGIIHNKTYNGTLILPNNYQNDFARGYFDADGWISILKHKVKYTRHSWGLCAYHSKNLELINDILPHKLSIYKKKSQHLYELRSSSSRKVKDICRFLNGKIRLESKWKKIDLLIK